MKTVALTAFLVLGTTTAVLAQADLDANADGMVTMEEMVAVYPDVTAEIFSEADVDDSGALDEDELAAAVEAGTIPSDM